MTIEMGSIRVVAVPECPENGGMVYTHDGSSVAVSPGDEFDLTENGTFGWEGGSECGNRDNTWAYYYTRAAVGRS